MVQPRRAERQRHGQECRADIAEEMTAREIAEAQRQARAWLTDIHPPRRLTLRRRSSRADFD